jgi:ribosome-binding protein aMBF1 (putative translation factor)
LPRVCEVCGRTEKEEQEDTEYEILDVCENCTTDRQQFTN